MHQFFFPDLERGEWRKVVLWFLLKKLEFVILCFQRSSNLVFSEDLYKKRTRLVFVFSKTLKKTFLSPCYCAASAVLHMSCNFHSLSLSPNIFALFSPASACTHFCSLLSCQCLHALSSARALTSTLDFPRFLLKWSFKCSAAFQRAFQPTWWVLDVTLESSKIVKLALTWAAMTQSHEVK